MDTDPSWADLPYARQAAAEGRYGTLLRLARTAAGLTLDQAGRQAGYSASTLSRVERGKQPLTDVMVLRRLAAVFNIPPRLFGLADLPGLTAVHRPIPAGKVPGESIREGGVDPVRRRELLGMLAGLATPTLLATTSEPATASSDPTLDLVSGLEEALLRRTTPVHAIGSTELPISATELRSGLIMVKVDFQASRYRALAARLPGLLIAADAGSTDPAVAAELYNTATHVLIKLKVAGLDWLAAERALAAARQAADPAVTASITRNVATLCRGAGRYDAAQRLALDAAGQLSIAGSRATAEHLSLYGLLVCNASYTAAQAGDRSRSVELLDEADAIAGRLGTDHNAHWTAFGPTNVILHRISACYALGDAGTAIEYARQVPPGGIRLPERQARYWVDVARAFHQWGKSAQCYRALIMAERAAPEEVRAQPKVRALAADLLTEPTRAGMTGLREFAIRVGSAQ